MGRSSKLFNAAMAVIAGAALCAPMAASAGPSVNVHVFDSRPVIVPHHEVHVQPAYQGRHWDQRGRRGACGADRWDPHVRYMPGELVRRKGELWVAKRSSARVWNENSPPERTPRLWSRAVCG